MRQVAIKIVSYLNSACYDLADQSRERIEKAKTAKELMDCPVYMDTHLAVKVIKVRPKARVEYLADEYYNDRFTIADLIGDKIYEVTRDDIEAKNQLIDFLAKELTHLPSDLWKELRK